MKRVHAHVADPRARDALEACVRAVAGMAAALEVATAEEVAALTLPDGVGVSALPLLVDDPPENLAASHETAARIAAGTRWLDSQTWVGDREATQVAKAMLDWERNAIAAKVARMYAIEDQSTVSDGDLAKLQIDPDRLERYLKTHYGDDARVSNFRQAIGGRSRQTAVFELHGTRLSNHLVVQRDHPASISRGGVAQQYPVLMLLATTTLKVSRPSLLETDRSVLGAPFMIIEAARGQVAGGDYFRPPAAPELALELAEQLAILHAVDPTSLIGELPSTIDSTDPSGWARELQAIESAWNRFAHAPSLTVAAALAWMRAHVDEVSNDLSIVHNDAAFHNILVDNGHFSSLLDFELVHLGHPAEDLGYCRPFIQEIAEWDDFVDAYIAAGGKRFTPQVVDYFSLRGGVNLLTLLQYGRSIFKSGATTDINLAEAATAFIPKQLGRVARMVEVVLDRDNSARHS